MSVMRRIAALLGISAYAALTPVMGNELNSPAVKATRARYGGALSPLPFTQTRWLHSDLESAELSADMGDLSQAARIMRSARKDGTVAGVLKARTGGLMRLPKKFRGDADMVAALEAGHESVRSVFDEMFPPTELANFEADGILLGVAIGELVEVEGRDFPVFVRLEPEFLRYRWHENRWYYVSIAGLIPITPGDGRWVLHTPGGRIAPWQNGLWRAVARAWLDKEHALLMKSNWEGKLANPARVAIAPQGASEIQKESWFRRVMAWGVNSVFGLTPGYDVKLLESNGRGYECFLKTIEASSKDIVIALTGSTVLVDGGTGFANADVHAAIRADLIKEDADQLAYTINTQGIPQWVIDRWGEEALERSALVEWDVTPPADRAAQATALTQAATAFTALQTALKPEGLAVDVTAFAHQFGLSLVKVKAEVTKLSDAPANDTRVAEREAA